MQQLSELDPEEVFDWDVEETFIGSPMNTRVYYNRNTVEGIPIKPRLRFKSLSESDVHRVHDDDEDPLQGVPSGHGQSPPSTSCFPTRVFFNRVRKSFKFRSKSTDELSSPLKTTTTTTEVEEDKEI